jgi:SAM-dependent methyltransferase
LKDVLDYNYTLYDSDPNRNLSDPSVLEYHSFHFQGPTDNLDVWRQYRLMEPVLERLSYTRERSWLTVGDGAYGLESIRMTRSGFTNVFPTDIDGKLLEVAKQRGLIDKYGVENGEQMSFADESFDYVLCKDSYHHMPRPMIALYEMLRIARNAVVLIEPQDPWIDPPIAEQQERAGYESVGNYIYTVSKRELTKVAQGLDLPAYAFKSYFDHCPPAIERIPVSPNSPGFNHYMRVILAGENAVQQKKTKGGMLFAILFKVLPTEQELKLFNHGAQGWEVTLFHGNPYRKRFL